MTETDERVKRKVRGGRKGKAKITTEYKGGEPNTLRVWVTTANGKRRLELEKGVHYLVTSTGVAEFTLVGRMAIADRNR